MATLYWYGGSGNWTDFANHWSNNSGNNPASPAAAAPTSADNVIFDANSGLSGATITIPAGTTNADCLNFTAQTGVSWILTAASGGTRYLNIYGSAVFESGLSLTGTYLGSIHFHATASKTVTCNGMSFTKGLVFDGTGGTWTLQDNLATSSSFYIYKGTFDANDHNVTVQGMIDITPATGATANLYMGSGTWTVGYEVYINNGDGGTVNVYCETSTVTVYSTKTYCIWDCQGTYYIIDIPATCGEFYIYWPISVTNIIKPATTGYSFSNVQIIGGETIAIAGTFDIHGSEALNTMLTSLNDVQDSNSQASTNYTDLYSGGITAVGQSFVTSSTQGRISRLRVGLRKFGSPTGYAVAKIYTHSGTYGTSSVPGTLVATSDNFAVSVVTSLGDSSSYDFNFSGDQRVALDTTTNYVVVIEYSGGDASNYLKVRHTTSSTHGGNLSTYSGSWSADSAKDIAYFSIQTKQTHTLSKASGVVECDYLNISYSVATGGALWYAGLNSTDGGFNTGWFFGALQTKTFTADGIIIERKTATITADGIIAERKTSTITADGIVRATQTKTFTADGIVKIIQTKEVTADGYVKEIKTKEITADGVVKIIQTKTLTADGVVKAITIKEVTADGIVRAVQTTTITADGVVKVTQTSTFTADGIVKEPKTKEITADGVVRATQSKEFTADGIVKIINVKEFTSDGIIKSILNKTFTSDGIVKEIKTATITADGVVKEVQIKTFTADGSIRSELVKTFTADGIVKASSTQTITADGVIKEIKTAIITADGYIRAIFTKEITADGIVKVTGTQAITADGIIKEIHTTTVTADGRVVGQYTKTFTADGIVFATNTISITVDGEIGRKRTHSLAQEKFKGFYDEEDAPTAFKDDYLERLGIN